MLPKGMLKTNLEKRMNPFYSEVQKFRLPPFVEREVLRLAKKAVEMKLTMSYSKIEITAGLIYLVLKEFNLSPLIKDITKVYSITKNKLLRVSKFLSQNLNLKIKPTEDIENYLIRIVNDLLLPSHLVKKALQKSKKLDIISPLVKTGTSLWLVANEDGIKVAKSQIARALGISETALKKNIKKFT